MEPRLVSIIFLPANICMCVSRLCNRRHHSTAVWEFTQGSALSYSANHKMHMSCTMHIHTSSKGPEWRRHPHMSSLPSLCEPCSVPKRYLSSLSAGSIGPKWTKLLSDANWLLLLAPES